MYVYIPDVKQGKEAKHEVTPFVGGGYQSAHQAGNDNDPREERGGQDVGEGETRSEQEEYKEKREVDEPLDVADILQKSYGSDIC